MIKRKLNLAVTVSLVILQFFSSSVFAGFLYLPFNKLYTPTGYVGSYLGHTGTDYHGDGYDTPIYVAYDGIVVAMRESENDGCDITRAQQLRWGNYVKIDHQIGSVKYRTEYWHLKQNGVVVKVGQRVKTGDLIAYISNSGDTNGVSCIRPDLPKGSSYHLHFEIKKWNGSGWVVLNPYSSGSGWLWTTNPPTPATQAGPIPCTYSVGQDSSRKSLFEQAHIRNGGRDILGCPSAPTYWWKAGSNWVVRQDFSSSAILQHEGVNDSYAYVVKGAIWSYFKSHSGLGAPISDEFTNSFSRPQSNFTKGFIFVNSSGSSVPVDYGDWYWITKGADTTLNASFQDAEGGGVQLVLNGLGGSGGWVSGAVVANDINDISLTPNSILVWEQYDKAHSLHFVLTIIDSRGETHSLTYSANASNVWGNQGYVDMGDSSGYNIWKLFVRNVFDDYQTEWGANPVSIKEIKVSHYLHDSWVGDKGGTVQNITFDYEVPETEIEVIPDFPDGGEGWYLSPPFVTLTAVDDASGVDRIEYNLGLGWQSYTEPFLIEKNGEFTLQYRAIDRAERVEQTKSRSFKIDTDLPQTELSATGPYYESEDGNVYVSPQTEFELSAEDETSGVSQTTFSVDEGESQLYDEEFPVTGQDGLRVVDYSSEDNAGNVEPLNFQEVYLDSTVPVSSDDSDGEWHNTAVTVAITAQDPAAPDETPGSGVQEINYGGSQEVEVTGDQAQVTFTAEGTHDLLYHAIDNVENVEDWKTADQIKIDKTPPTIEGSVDTDPSGVDAEGNDWYNEDVTVQFTATDQLHLSGVKSVTPDVVVSTEGVNQEISGIAEDNAGNTSRTTVRGINIDKTAPSIIGAPTGAPNEEGWYNHDVAVHFDANDQENLSGLASVTPDVIVSTEGADQEIIGVAADGAGNTANTVVSGINIDKTKPESMLRGLSPYYNEIPIEIYYDSFDSLSGVDRIRLYKNYQSEDWEYHNGSSREPDQSFVVGTLEEGRWEFSSCAVDRAGNEECSVSTVGDVNGVQTSTIYDITDPASEVASIEEGEYYNAETWSGITGTAGDTNPKGPEVTTSGVARVEVRIDKDGGEGEWLVVNGMEDWEFESFLEDGFYTVYSRAADRAGNQESTFAVSFVYDATDPVSSINLSGSTGLYGWYVSPVVVDLAAFDATAGVAQTFYRISGGKLQAHIEPLVLGDGFWEVELWSIDKAGNEEGHQFLTFKVDTIAPLVPVSSVGEGSFFDGEQITVSLRGEDSAQIYYSLGVVEPNLYGGPFVIWGDLVLSAYAVDEAGNQSETASWDFVFDPKPIIPSKVLGASVEPSEPVALAEPPMIVENGFVKGAATAETLDGSSKSSNQVVFYFLLLGFGGTLLFPLRFLLRRFFR